MAPVRRQHSHDMRCLCISKWKKGYSYSKISAEVELPRTTVRDIVTYFKKNVHCVIRPHQDRPRLTTAGGDRRILGDTEADRFSRAAVLAAVVSKDTGHTVSPQVVRSRLNTPGLNGRSAR
ncbi:hypothetical protein PC129_g13919 [Phytophthora cactorum]|uniref:Homeodomain-like n=1 Tax=Phytophthora cactorum TaxID=29920 RepID=A0A329SD00_9STRA|nr:hypothetical protein Pcac1_g16397 [Phytophthora cactorum]KAG2813578.1 hypothetical protein PC111_g14325 [Phytophthora cactorum]KAG2828471.1 hypothetical protein PC112_g8456 [Phytophthora cactorum]KAG2855038.1 hypothetical protein PC113_g12788 [Phytophthora cactorum]KAG2906581.1 hypothetical protein PC114_g11093 [Phytophthora cactorum]